MLQNNLGLSDSTKMLKNRQKTVQDTFSQMNQCIELKPNISEVTFTRQLRMI